MADESMRDKGVDHEVEGTTRELKGKVQKNVGKLTGNESQELKGKGKEVLGKVQKEAGRLMQDDDKR